MAFCPSCGANVERGAAFCSNCGQAFRGARRDDRQVIQTTKVQTPGLLSGCTQGIGSAIGCVVVVIAIAIFAAGSCVPK